MRKLLLIPLLISAGACGGDGGTGGTGGAQLTAAEAAELNRAVFGVAAALASSGGFGASLNAVPGPVTAENTITIPFQETQPCEPSGTVDVEGTMTVSFDNIGQSTTIDAELSAAPDDCAHRMENGGIITITGDPDIDVEMSATGGPNGLAALQMTETGAFTWARGGASGRCAVSVAAQLNAATQMIAVTGTFCGFPVSETFPVGE